MKQMEKNMLLRQLLRGQWLMNIATKMLDVGARIFFSSSFYSTNKA